MTCPGCVHIFEGFLTPRLAVFAESAVLISSCVSAVCCPPLSAPLWTQNRDCYFRSARVEDGNYIRIGGLTAASRVVALSSLCRPGSRISSDFQRQPLARRRARSQGRVNLKLIWRLQGGYGNGTPRDEPKRPHHLRRRPDHAIALIEARVLARTKPPGRQGFSQSWEGHSIRGRNSSGGTIRHGRIADGL